MTRAKKDDKAQSKRFINKARELETDESGEAFDRALNKVIIIRRPTSPKTSSK